MYEMCVKYIFGGNIYARSKFSCVRSSQDLCARAQLYWEHCRPGVSFQHQRDSGNAYSFQEILCASDLRLCAHNGFYTTLEYIWNRLTMLRCRMLQMCNYRSL